MGYFLAAYAVTWALVFGLTFTLSRRQARLEREVALLRELLSQPPER